MDIQTSQELLLGEMNRRTTEDRNRQLISLIKAMEYHYRDRFWFNSGTYEDSTKTGQQDYAINTLVKSTADPVFLLPHDFLFMLRSQIQVGQNWYDPMQECTFDFIREATFFDGQLGYPDTYAWYDNKIWLYSIPKSDFPWRIDYVKQTQDIRYRWSGAAWIAEQFQFDTGSGEFIWVALDPTFSNVWLQQAEPMIRAWARWDLYMNYYDDAENAAKARAVYDTEKRRIRANNNSFYDRRRTEPSIF